MPAEQHDTDVINPELYRDAISEESLDKTTQLFTEFMIELEVPDEVMRDAQKLFADGYEQTLELPIGVIAAIAVAGDGINNDDQSNYDRNAYPYNIRELEAAVEEYTFDSTTSITKAKRKICTGAGVFPEPVDPHAWVRRFATETDIPDEVTDLAHAIIDASECDSSPSVFAAAAIYRASTHLTLDDDDPRSLTQEEVGDFFHRTPEQIRKWYRDLTVPE